MDTVSNWQVASTHGVTNLSQHLTGNSTQSPLQRALPRGNIFLQVSLSMQRCVTKEFFQDNTEYAFLQMDDRVLVYRGADQPDMSVINPESDVWQHIKASLIAYDSDVTDPTF
jgi:hypothetical protein